MLIHWPSGSCSASASTPGRVGQLDHAPRLVAIDRPPAAVDVDGRLAAELVALEPDRVAVGEPDADDALLVVEHEVGRRAVRGDDPVGQPGAVVLDGDDRAVVVAGGQQPARRRVGQLAALAGGVHHGEQPTGVVTLVAHDPAVRQVPGGERAGRRVLVAGDVTERRCGRRVIVPSAAISNSSATPSLSTMRDGMPCSQASSTASPSSPSTSRRRG